MRVAEFQCGLSGSGPPTKAFMNEPLNKRMFWRLWLRALTVKRPQAVLATSSLLVGGATVSARPGKALQVVVHESGNARIGLVVDEILELVEDEIALNEVRGRPGVVGSSVIRGRATDLLDLPALLAHANVPGFAAAVAEGGPRP